MDDSSSSSGSGGVGGVDDGGSASASVVAGAGAAAAGNRDQEQDQPSHQQKQHEQQQHLQMRRLSYTTPATPFVGTPAGAPPDPACATSRHCYSGPSDPLGNSGNNGDDDDDDNERKMPANLQHRQQQGQPVAVDSHLHLDDIRHPPLHPHHHHPQPQPQSRPQSAHDSAAAASASASVASHPSPQQQPQQQPHPTPQTRSSALLSAQHCASCALASTPPNLADRAVKSAHAAFKVSCDLQACHMSCILIACVVRSWLHSSHVCYIETWDTCDACIVTLRNRCAVMHNAISRCIVESLDA